MMYPQMNRYEIERLRKLERAAEREQKALDASQEVDEMDDAAIVAKHLHLSNVEACEELLKRLRIFHPEKDTGRKP